MRSSLILAACVLLASCVAPGDKAAPAPAAEPAPLHTEVYGGSDVNARIHTLVIVIHDDAEPGTRTSEKAFAQAAMRVMPETVSATILRPGHRDAEGHASPGDRGNGHGDDLTVDRLAKIGAAVLDLKRRYPRANVILVGDGGGAAVVANLAGLHPDLADAIMLVGCPCALPEWRTHMGARTGDTAWTLPVTSLDPLKTAGGVSTSLRVVVVVGANDQVTPVKFSRAYVEALTLRGIATDYRIIPGGGHDLLGKPDVAMAALTHLAARLPEKP